MTGARIRAAIGLGILLVMAAFCVWRFEFTSEITYFLPGGSGPARQDLARLLAESDLSRTMILSIRAPDAVTATQATGKLALRLRSHPEVDRIRTSPGIDAASQQAVFDLYFSRRLLLLSDDPENELPDRLSDAGLERAARELKRALSSPIAPLLSRVAGADPLLAFPAQLARLGELQEDRLQLENGRFVSADGLHGIVFLTSRSSAFDTAAQAPLLDEIERVFQAINVEHRGTLGLEMNAIQRFAIASEQSIRSDIARISLLSTIAGVILILLVFRSARYVVLLMIPLAAGMVSGLFACLALFGKVHGITLAFGASLIGVGIDYPIHLFNHHTLHPDPDGAAGALRRIWNGLLLGALTTIAGLAGMAWTSFPGIREIAVFAPAGVAGALLATRFVLPPLMPPSSGPGRLQLWLSNALFGVNRAIRDRRMPLVAIAAAAFLLGAVGLPISNWNDDLSALNAFDPGLLEESERVRDRVTSIDSGRFVMAIAGDEETALRLNDAVYLLLAQARADGLIDGFRSAHSLVWSRELQDRNDRVIRSAPRLIERARAAFSAEGFRSDALDRFADALSTGPPPPLTVADLRQSPLADAIRPFRLSIPPGDQVGILTMLRDVRDGHALARRLESLDGVTYFDQSEHLREVYGRFRTRTGQVIVAGLFAVFGMVYARYRRLRPAIVAFVPALLAAGAALGLLSLLGMELNLLHLVGTLLVLSLGVDYGIFMMETRGGGDARMASLLSIVIACLTTVLSFGLMGLSDNPALRGIGLTTGIGSILCLVLTTATVALNESGGQTP